ncbi:MULTISPECIES: DUF952 domain-containing protein [unclassified Streptomyces]|uniref:DUF952 domain-containing protein n=1 Tax=unclassified Streptomyces TaxID=2593676 RepID=UPI0033E70510
MIFHVVPAPEWGAGPGPYAPASLASEGFVHCSADRASALEVANAHYAHYPRCADAPGPLLLLGIDEARLDAEVRWEGAFPHVYGPVGREAVVEAAELRRDGGRWVAP